MGSKGKIISGSSGSLLSSGVPGLGVGSVLLRMWETVLRKGGGLDPGVGPGRRGAGSSCGGSLVARQELALVLRLRFSSQMGT